MPATSNTSLRLLASKQAAGRPGRPPRIPHRTIPHMRLLAAVLGKSIFEMASQVHDKTRARGH